MEYSVRKQYYIASFLIQKSKLTVQYAILKSTRVVSIIRNPDFQRIALLDQPEQSLYIKQENKDFKY